MEIVLSVHGCPEKLHGMLWQANISLLGTVRSSLSPEVQDHAHVVIDFFFTCLWNVSSISKLVIQLRYVQTARARASARVDDPKANPRAPLSNRALVSSHSAQRWYLREFHQSAAWFGYFKPLNKQSVRSNDNSGCHKCERKHEHGHGHKHYIVDTHLHTTLS